MIENTKTQLIVDSQDLACQICFSPFGLEENLPMTASCGHTFCSACIQRLRKCAICNMKFDARQIYSKSISISSFLLSHSQVKKCAVHHKPSEVFCLEEKRLLCSVCLAEKRAVVSMKEIEEKACQLRKITQDTKETYKVQIEKFLKTEQEDFKKRIDQIFSQEVCYAPVLKERLYKEIQYSTIGFEKICHKNGLLEKIKKTEIMLEKWRRNNQQNDDGLAKEIIETKLDFAAEIFEKTKAELTKEMNEKQNKLLTEINNNQFLIKCLSKKLQGVFERPPYMLLDSIPLDLELQYLVEICKEFKLIAMDSTYCQGLVLKTCGETSWKARFNPLFFDCRIEVLDVACMYSLNFLQSLAVFGQILENLSNLESFTITLFKMSELEFSWLSDSILRLKKLKEFSIRINKINDATYFLAKFCADSRGLRLCSRFEIQLESGFFYDTVKAKLIN